MGSATDGPGRSSLANIPLGWMVKEAIMAGGGPVFRRDAFTQYSGVLEVIGSEALHHGGFEFRVPQTLEPATTLISSLAAAFRPTTVAELPLEEQLSHLLWLWETLRVHDPTSELVNSARTVTLSRAKKADLIPQAFTQDVCAEAHDPLKAKRGWWIFEYLPLWEMRVEHDGRVTKGFR